MTRELSVKVTKKFEDMNPLERVYEGTKMFFFGDRVADHYLRDLRYFRYLERVDKKQNDKLVSLDVTLMKRRLIESQRLLAKYNDDVLILGAEIINEDDEDYELMIKPYKAKTGKKLINLIFG